MQSSARLTGSFRHSEIRKLAIASRQLRREVFNEALDAQPLTIGHGPPKAAISAKKSPSQPRSRSNRNTNFSDDSTFCHSRIGKII